MRVATWLGVLVAGCGGATATAPAGDWAETPAERADPLLGAWWTGSAPDGDALPCPLEVEVFEDGTAEVDFLNDDSTEKMCSFARVPAVRTAGEPPVVRFGGQLEACIWRREGSRLRLACEDHAQPPRDFGTSVLLERRRVRALHGLEALVGTWTTASFWSAPQTLTIAEDGRVRFLGEDARASVTGDAQLEFESARGVQRCLYRAIVDRLTLRCGALGRAAPTSFTGAQLLETLVLRRQGGPAQHAPRPGLNVLSVPGVARDGDRDGDGMGDETDRCPDDPEDFDAFEDEDGCPEPDNDRDGILDASDRCPLVPEDRDGDADEDGCPEAAGGDRDGDGLLDDRDQCPDDPEDRDGSEDADGCPDPDNDQDGIMDVDDVCPNDPETRNGRADDDGCPDR